MDSNHRPLPCQGSALDQLSYGPILCGEDSRRKHMFLEIQRQNNLTTLTRASVPPERALAACVWRQTSGAESIRLSSCQYVTLPAKIFGWRRVRQTALDRYLPVRCLLAWSIPFCRVRWSL